MDKIGVIGAGSMGRGIAQVAATAGHEVVVVDQSEQVLNQAKSSLLKIMNRLVEKGRMSKQQIEEIQARINYTTSMHVVADANVIIEAIVESLSVKKSVFSELEDMVSKDTILASNTSSLSIASIASACSIPERVIGIHFFNPAPLMKLVEIIPAIQTSKEVVDKSNSLIASWGKHVAIAKDTPGFIVNRVARPFYGEALRIYEEGIASMEEIDAAMVQFGGFRMGPFTLMDFIGNDVNYAVTESVFKAFYYDSRYKPSLTQCRYSEAGWLGRKVGRGYYDYSKEVVDSKALSIRSELKEQVVDRILVMLFNEAIDALYLNIADREAIDTAMTKGVNYPKGLLAWADEKGLEWVLGKLDQLFDTYKEERYRASVLLRRKVAVNTAIYC